MLSRPKLTALPRKNLLADSAYWAIFEHSLDAIVIADSDGRFVDVNPAACTIFGLPHEDLVGMSILDFATSDLLLETVGRWRRFARTGKGSKGELALRKADGSPLMLEYSASRDIVPGLHLSILRDVTEEVEARKRLEASEKALQEALHHRDEFLSVASHELKTPLTSLKLKVQTLRRQLDRGARDAFTPDRIRRLLSDDERQVDRLTRLINDMLDVSRIQSGRLSLEPELFDLAELVREVVEQHQNNAGVAVGADAGAVAGASPIVFENLETVMGDWDRFRIAQVITNLLQNAVKYGEGKLIAIHVSRERQHAVLRVRDEGRGIAPADLTRIFHVFERAVSGIEISGLGLGLFIVRQILDLHGGEIEVESELGRGATFIVRLPLA